MKTKYPLINIITRASRKDAVVDCIQSVNGQTYKNFHHIITYETEEFKQHLTKYVNPYKTTLCKVQWVKPIDELRLKFWYKECMDIDNIPFELTNEPHNDWFAHPEGSEVIFKHFPPNLYLLKAERYVEDGWVIYLDDECTLYNDKSLETLVDHIVKYDEDYLHWIFANNKAGFKTDGDISDTIYKEYDKNAIVPIVGLMRFIEHGGFPPLGTLGASNYCFHSKHLQHTRWSCWRGDDWRTAVSLNNNIKNRNIIRTQPIINISNSA